MGSVIRLAAQPVLAPCPAAPELLTLLAAALAAAEGPAPVLGISCRGAHADVLTLSQDAAVLAGGRARASRVGGKVRRVPAAVASFAAADARSAAAEARWPAAAANCVDADSAVRADPLVEWQLRPAWITSTECVQAHVGADGAGGASAGKEAGTQRLPAVPAAAVLLHCASADSVAGAQPELLLAAVLLHCASDGRVAGTQPGVASPADAAAAGGASTGSAAGRQLADARPTAAASLLHCAKSASIAGVQQGAAGPAAAVAGTKGRLTGGRGMAPANWTADAAAAAKAADLVLWTAGKGMAPRCCPADMHAAPAGAVTVNRSGMPAQCSTHTLPQAKASPHI